MHQTCGNIRYVKHYSSEINVGPNLNPLSTSRAAFMWALLHQWVSVHHERKMLVVYRHGAHVAEALQANK